MRAMELDALYAELFARPLWARTVGICHTIVRQSLEQARKWGLIARNPALDVTPPGQARREVTPPTADQVRALLAAARDDDPDLGLYLWLLAATGCRRGKACALRWTDIDLDRGDVLIQRSIALVEGQVHEKGTKTHQSRRVALDASTVALLREHRRRCQEVALALGVRLPSEAYLFSEAGDFRRPWRPTCAPTASPGSAGGSACHCMTSATSWPRPSAPTPLRSPPSAPASATGTRPRRSTSTATPSRQRPGGSRPSRRPPRRHARRTVVVTTDRRRLKDRPGTHTPLQVPLREPARERTRSR
jgi:hypothetical protein